MFENLTDENVNLYQMKAYENPQCFSIDEFMDDMKRIKYIKRLFYRYHTKKILKERLILNHLVVLYNVLGNEACTRILFLKTDEVQYYILKSFLLFINKLPVKVEGIRSKDIFTSDISLDENIISVLREI
tara:strand:- start:12018 stop:12407 length:390 start_codon:yes stop_codon:yes gene_type:complete